VRLTAPAGVAQFYPLPPPAPTTCTFHGVVLQEGESTRAFEQAQTTGRVSVTRLRRGRLFDRLEDSLHNVFVLGNFARYLVSIAA
jgi:uncharacterized iron-regulated membrane protein